MMQSWWHFESTIRYTNSRYVPWAKGEFPGGPNAYWTCQSSRSESSDILWPSFYPLTLGSVSMSPAILLPHLFQLANFHPTPFHHDITLPFQPLGGLKHKGSLQGNILESPVYQFSVCHFSARQYFGIPGLPVQCVPFQCKAIFVVYHSLLRKRHLSSWLSDQQ